MGSGSFDEGFIFDVVHRQIEMRVRICTRIQGKGGDNPAWRLNYHFLEQAGGGRERGERHKIHTFTIEMMKNLYHKKT